MSNYFKNLDKTIIQANQKSFRYGDGKAWNNVKRKNCLRYMPRGKAYKRLCKLIRKSEWAKITSNCEALIKELGLKF